MREYLEENGYYKFRKVGIDEVSNIMMSHFIVRFTRYVCLKHVIKMVIFHSSDIREERLQASQEVIES